jgi:hypothetical protein
MVSREVPYITFSLRVLISKTEAGESVLHIKADTKKFKKKRRIYCNNKSGTKVNAMKSDKQDGYDKRMPLNEVEGEGYKILAFDDERTNRKCLYPVVKFCYAVR